MTRQMFDGIFHVSEELVGQRIWRIFIKRHGDCFAAGKNAISVIYVRQKVAKVGQLTMAAHALT